MAKVELTDGLAICHSDDPRVFDGCVISQELLVKRAALAVYLVAMGYKLDDALEIEQAYAKAGRVKDAIAVIDDWDDEEHDYTGELARYIIDWERNG